MSERPILFSASMVRAILEGRKTQTRRIVKPQPPDDCATIRVEEFHPTVIDRLGDEEPGAPIFGAYDLGGEWGVRCPYGQPGDRLYVREAFRFLDVFDGDSPATIGDRCLNAGYSKPWAPAHYEADGQRNNWQHVGTPPHDGGPPKAGKLRPGIHMPRWASRITLEIVAVRVERLNDISEADAKAEGAGIPLVGHDDDFCRGVFRGIWESINGADSWGANPWVWVIEFKLAAGRHLDGKLHDEYPR